jgi:hypothetical protein
VAAKVLDSVHILFTSLPFRPASGLRLEIALNIDKEKSEFYFSFALKKILTENRKKLLRNRADASSSGELTELAHSCTFRENIGSLTLEK